jgi:uncharacterized protein (TIGR01244 family)
MRVAHAITGPGNFYRAAAIVIACLATSLVNAQSAELPNRNDPLEGITTAGQPSADALAAVAAAGYRTVIDLRAPGEDRGMNEPETVEALGMKYISLPVSGAGGVTYENASLLDSLLEDAEGPVLLHCASSNRVGALLSLRAKLDGADDVAALELGLASGLSSLQSAVETKLAEAQD